jgi:hypothetical protein
MGRYLSLLVVLAACGEPILKNAPKPDPGAVAGVAAAAAAAVTLADPTAAAKRQEAQNKGEPDNRGVTVKETVPADVFDRLDRKATNDAGVVEPAGAPASDAAGDASPKVPAPKAGSNAPAVAAPPPVLLPPPLPPPSR